MTKHKSLIGVTLSIVLVSLVWLTPTMKVSAITSTNSSKAPTDCTNANLQNLINRYQIKYDWNNSGTTITFKASHGEFRFTFIDTKFFTNSFSKDSNGFYLIDGKKAVVSKNNTVKLTIKNSARGDSATVNLALSKADGACDSYPTYVTKKAAGQTTRTFDTGKFEIVIPFSSSDQTIIKESNKTNYNGVCRALREGKNYQGKISANILKEYDNSTNAKSYYKIIAPSCFDSSKTAAYVYSEKRMIKIIESALSTWKTYDALNNKNSIGGGPADVTGDQWLIDFSKVKENAIEAKHMYYADGKGNFYKALDQNGKYGSVVKAKNQAFSMKCKVTANSSTDYSNLLEYKTDAKGNSVYNLDANLQSYYAYDQSTQSVTYNWYTHWKNKKNSSAKSVTVDKFCTKKCEEAVEVKYGPPVASKAGLCFEYEVQVTSRVKCTTSINGQPPEPEKPLCIPIPYCNDIPGHTHQAGASDEYKACVQSCDGGKYTEKCSNKCYSEVYEGNSDSSKTSVDSFEDTAEKVYSKTYSYNGYHYFAGSKIRWSGKGYANYYYYFERGRTSRDHGKYVPESGFKKRLYSTGTCKDPCFFSSCSKQSYVNKSDFMDDYMDNLAAYKTAINACKASASCTTKTATLKISADYKNSKGVIKTVDYPYTTSTNNLVSDGNKNRCSANSSEGEDNVILSYAGCYKKCGNGLQYQTKWSFPGTWLNKKTGSLAFKKPTTEGWKETKDKFCLPLDAKDVNVKWWNYYYGYYDSNHTTSYDKQAVKDKCVTLNHTSISEEDIEKWDVNGVKRWNINASTRMFGYYGWSFDIACFYALNSSQIKTVGNNSTNAEKCNTNIQGSSTAKTAYRIRSVDLKNLFPDASSSDGKRAPGFNWSDSANVLAENGKNKEYESKPSLYAEKIQSSDYQMSLYSDQNLDYEFNLTKDMLKKLKSGSRNYSDFKGNMITQHGMYSYKSDAIRTGVFSAGNNKVLKEGAIGCNNVGNYASTDCTKAVGGGE